MLDFKTKEIIKRTVPVLEAHGEAITTRFYQRLFTRHPELKNIFNQTHQREGKQQRALAEAVYAAALHIDRLEEILPVVQRVGHKHRGLGVKPEHYPIVGENLLAAIQEVLGEAATDEIIEAWEKAYRVIADVFIQVEKDMYEKAEEKTGGWDGFRHFVIRKKIKESEVITSFYLQPEDGGPIADFLPGQYLTFKMEIPGETYTHMRHYSLSDSPGKEYYRISIKREEGRNGKPGGIVSNYWHDRLQEGDRLTVSAPAGDFVLDTSSDCPVVLISGGVGLTPLVSMLNTLVETDSGRDVTFIHAAQSGRHHGMKKHVRELAEKHANIHSLVCYERPTDEDRQEGAYDREGRIDGEWLKEINLSPDAEYYLCGPVPFMKSIYQALIQQGISAERIRYEIFGPTNELVDQEELETLHS